MPARYGRWIPEPIKAVLRPLYNRLANKHACELAYWKGQFEAEQGVFGNAHYRRLLLAMAEEPDDAFLEGKIVADFGCGPKGSLVWARSAALRIGIDVLADRYAPFFEDRPAYEKGRRGCLWVKARKRTACPPPETLESAAIKKGNRP